MSCSLTFFHTCSGTIGIGSSGRTAFGFLRVRTTVFLSGAVTFVTEVRYDAQVAASGPPSMIRL